MKYLILMSVLLASCASCPEPKKKKAIEPPKEPTYMIAGDYRYERTNNIA